MKTAAHQVAIISTSTELNARKCTHSNDCTFYFERDLGEIVCLQSEKKRRRERGEQVFRTQGHKGVNEGHQIQTRGHARMSNPCRMGNACIQSTCMQKAGGPESEDRE